MSNEHGTLLIPEAAHEIPETPFLDLDAAVEEVGKHARQWAELGTRDRIDLIEEIITDTVALAQTWVETACRHKQIAFDSPAAGEEWQSGPQLVLRNLRLLKDSLQDIVDHGVPQFVGPVTELPSGRLAVRVFPTDNYDRALFLNMTAELWMEDGITRDNLADHQAAAHRAGGGAAAVALVLGAGNIASIGFMDALYRLFVLNNVVVLKMNPVNEYLGPIINGALRVLRDRGFVRVVYGGADAGEHLCRHNGIDEIHVTGSDKTYEAIVYGRGDEGRKRRARDERVNTKPITAELGNVTPVIVVPGPWSDSEVAYQAESIATMLAHNAGFNCIAARVIVQHGQWDRREALLAATRDTLRSLKPRAPYYPGAEDRWRWFVDAHPEAERFGPEGDGYVPWTLIAGLDHTRADDVCFTTEVFAGVFGESPISAPTPQEYLRKAVEFANDQVWGSLGVTIIAHPKTLKDPAMAAAIEQAIADLRYGTVALNAWSGVAYAAVSATWGAYPGHEPTDIQSGRGVVHNTYMFDGVEKAVVRGPFRSFPKPPWFVTHRNSHNALKRLTYFEAAPSPAKLAGILSAAVRA